MAEGHLDLNRKLDEALKIADEKEMMGVHLNYLDGEVLKIKGHLNLPA